MNNNSLTSIIIKKIETKEYDMNREDLRLSKMLNIMNELEKSELDRFQLGFNKKLYDQVAIPIIIFHALFLLMLILLFKQSVSIEISDFNINIIMITAFIGYMITHVKYNKTIISIYVETLKINAKKEDLHRFVMFGKRVYLTVQITAILFIFVFADNPNIIASFLFLSFLFSGILLFIQSSKLVEKRKEAVLEEKGNLQIELLKLKGSLFSDESAMLSIYNATEIKNNKHLKSIICEFEERIKQKISVKEYLNLKVNNHLIND